MPLYDCMLLLKPHVTKESLMDLVARVGKHVYSRNGVLTEIKSFGTVQLGYGVKKLDGRYYQISYGLTELNYFLYHLEGEALDIVETVPQQLRLLTLVLSAGKLMQMTMMTPPTINDELHYLNKEDRLLRWLLVKHRDIKFGLESLDEEDGKSELKRLRRTIFDYDDDKEEEEDDEDEYPEEEQEEERKE
ncbi:hypothetical protein LguiA_018755 [Lonicera macranthoides]